MNKPAHCAALGKLIVYFNVNSVTGKKRRKILLRLDGELIKKTAKMSAQSDSAIKHKPQQVVEDKIILSHCFFIAS